MCGVIAFVGKGASDPPVAPVARALESMARRGPDSEGSWQDQSCILGHRRLAIIDLDKRAGQPMTSLCGRYIIVFNGEIYNYRDLQAQLRREGVQLRTNSDTEVLLEMFAREGESMLPKLRGMFAFVIWDRTTRRAFAARDPYGIKPLYVAVTTSGTFIASQVKALIATGLVAREPCARGQAGFWLLGSVPEPHTWFRDIRALPSGHFMWIEHGVPHPARSWWNIGEHWHQARVGELTLEEVRSQVAAALRRSVAAHLVADVPVGLFLSGGVDSGALAGLIREAGATELHGITISYDEFAGRHEDEAPIAAAVARRYSIRHHIRKVTRAEFINDLPRIIDAMDQPSVDGINTWYASKAVAEAGLKVVVSGVGGDELFQGYSSFRQLPPLVSAWQAASRIPGAMVLARLGCAIQARRTGNHRWHELPDWARSVGGAWWLRRGVFAPADLPALMGPLAADALTNFSVPAWLSEMSGPLPRDARLALGQIESTTYLRNQLLRDSDWASMDHSVELRTPLVDAWLLRDVQTCLPKFKHFPGKRLLAEAPMVALPDAVIQRRKTGFAIPIQRWMRESNFAPRPRRQQHPWGQNVAHMYQEAF